MNDGRARRSEAAKPDKSHEFDSQCMDSVQRAEETGLIQLAYQAGVSTRRLDREVGKRFPADPSETAGDDDFVLILLHHASECRLPFGQGQATRFSVVAAGQIWVERTRSTAALASAQVRSAPSVVASGS